MSKKKSLALVLLCAVLTVFGIASAEEAQPSHGDIMDQWTQLMIDRAEKNAPQIRTLENGVQIQRTPSEYEIISTQNVPGGTISWNNKYLKADQRGCTACHADFNDLLSVENLGYVHTNLETEYDIEITYKTCYYCHTYIGDLYHQVPWRDMIHGAHMGSNAFDAMGGDCMSCHYADEGGTMQMWDEVKYEHLWGINNLASDTVTGEFAYDQEFCGTQDSMFTMAWFITHHYGEDYQDNYHRISADYRGVDSVDLSVYDTWTIEFGGMLDKPVTYTMSELIEKFPSETFKAVTQCIDNPVGGPYITQVEMTGISVMDVLESCGIQEGAKGIHAQSRGVGNDKESFEFMEQYGEAYLVYQVAGEPLKEEYGFPCMLYMPCMPADHHGREVIRVTVTAEDDSAYAPSNNYWTSGKPWFPARVITPNSGFFSVKEGQIIEAYEPFTFEGWADDFHRDIKAIEFSFDQGATWTSFDTSDTKAGRWVHWTFTWTPPKEGAYTIMVRSVNENGEATPEPVKTMVNAKVL